MNELIEIVENLGKKMDAKAVYFKLHVEDQSGSITAVVPEEGFFQKTREEVVLRWNSLEELKNKIKTL